MVFVRRRHVSRARETAESGSRKNSPVEANFICDRKQFPNDVQTKRVQIIIHTSLRAQRSSPRSEEDHGLFCVSAMLRTLAARFSVRAAARCRVRKRLHRNLDSVPQERPAPHERPPSAFGYSPALRRCNRVAQRAPHRPEFCAPDIDASVVIAGTFPFLH